MSANNEQTDAPPDDNDAAEDGSDEQTIRLGIDPGGLKGIIDEKASDLRAEAAGYEPGGLHGIQNEYRLGVHWYDGIGPILGQVVANVLPHQDERFGDVAPEDISVSAIHIQAEKPSYIEFWVATDERVGVDDE